MKKKAKIRIIKKKDLRAFRKVVKTETEAKQESAREMVSNVSNWVNDFQKRKRVETKQAIEQLFPARPQTDGA
jgi:lysyl-tRNA synthetase class I